MKIGKLILVLSLIIISCKDEFFPDLDTFESSIVVNGLITNEEVPYMVKISKSSPINNFAINPYENCVVTIIENTGTTEILKEIEPGKYVTSESGIKGIIGNEYSLSIFTPEGKEYHSDFQELKELVELDTVYAELVSLVDINYIYGLPGYQFYINTKAAAVRENYFLWSMTETFEYDIDYQLAYMEVYFPQHKFTYYNPSFDSTETCWRTQNVNYIFTGTTLKLSSPQITHQPLHFVGTDTKKLTKRYSVLVQQYSIGEKAYNYWQSIEQQSSNENLLVASQPYTVRGNIENINNEEEIVLGYFTVGSVSQERVFVDNPGKPFYYNTSIVITDPVSIADFKKKYLPPYYWVQFDENTFGLIVKDCLDCRTVGGDLFKPEFWIDN